MKILFYSLFIIFLSGCSVFGDSGVEIAPYDVVRQAESEKIEIRTYSQMILVSTPMNGDERNGAFGRLFDYISGENVSTQDIAMTAPVFMDSQKQGQDIAMTAPVFMDDDGETQMMSFVMPADFTMETTPVPTNPNVKVHEIKDYTVAVITFNGRLSESNIEKHRDILEQWIIDNDYVVTGSVKSAGYNAPFTLPAMRRNEVLIPVAPK